MNMTDNKLLFWSLVFASIYWISGVFVPEYHSTVASAFLLVFGSVASSRYIPEAWSVVVQRRRDPGDPGGGSHLAAYGVALVAAGSVYVGLFGVVWVYFDQPESWVGTPISGFGRFVMAAGFALLFFSPDMEQYRIKLPNTTWLIVAGGIALLLAFYMGIKIGSAERSDYRSQVQCPATLPVKGKSSGVYHAPGGPYYQRTHPDACFASTAVASAFGFRRVVGPK